MQTKIHTQKVDVAARETNKKKNSDKFNNKSDDSSESSKTMSAKNLITPYQADNQNGGMKRSVVGLCFHPVY